MQSAKPPTHFEVAIIGGGPAGSVAATWLARQGHRVTQLERERFPRFHIGESLLPNGNQVLKEIGVWEKIEAAGFMEKRGAEFTLPDRRNSISNVFAKGLVPRMERAYQVERARFDTILFEHAAESGAISRQGAQVRSAKRVDSTWELEVEDLEQAKTERLRADWIIDASGRDTFMGRKLNLKKEELPYPGRMAVFAHFDAVPVGEGERAGDIIVMRLKDAWFWVIPLSAKQTSIGVVAHKGAGMQKGESRESFFWRKVGESPWLSNALQNASPITEFRIESDYSFSYERFGDDHVLLAGDAASFIDPVFSSGVFLATSSGLLAAKRISKQLKAKTNNPRLYQDYTDELKKQIRTIRNLIDTYYDNRSYEVFMTPQPPLLIDRSVNSILAGCLKPPFSVRWRFALFQLVCRIHKRFRLVPKLDW